MLVLHAAAAGVHADACLFFWVFRGLLNTQRNRLLLHARQLHLHDCTATACVLMLGALELIEHQFQRP